MAVSTNWDFYKSAMHDEELFFADNLLAIAAAHVPADAATIDSQLAECHVKDLNKRLILLHILHKIDKGSNEIADQSIQCISWILPWLSDSQYQAATREVAWKLIHFIDNHEKISQSQLKSVVTLITIHGNTKERTEKWMPLILNIIAKDSSLATMMKEQISMMKEIIFGCSCDADLQKCCCDRFINSELNIIENYALWLDAPNRSKGSFCSNDKITRDFTRWCPLGVVVMARLMAENKMCCLHCLSLPSLSLIRVVNECFSAQLPPEERSEDDATLSAMSEAFLYFKNVPKGSVQLFVNSKAIHWHRQVIEKLSMFCLTCSARHRQSAVKLLQECIRILDDRSALNFLHSYLFECPFDNVLALLLTEMKSRMTITSTDSLSQSLLSTYFQLNIFILQHNITQFPIALTTAVNMMHYALSIAPLPRYFVSFCLDSIRTLHRSAQEIIIDSNIDPTSSNQIELLKLAAELLLQSHENF